MVYDDISKTIIEVLVTEPGETLYFVEYFSKVNEIIQKINSQGLLYYVNETYQRWIPPHRIKAIYVQRKPSEERMKEIQKKKGGRVLGF